MAVKPQLVQFVYGHIDDSFGLFNLVPLIPRRGRASLALAKLMVERGLKKLPVTSGGKLVSIVSRADLVRLLADG